MALPSLIDGFIALCINSSLNVHDGLCRLLVEGQYIEVAGNKAIPDVPVYVPSVNQVDGLFTPGTVLAESLKKAFCACSQNIEIWALPREDKATGVKAAYTITITGIATSDGVFTLFMIDEEYTIEFDVLSGDTPTIIASALEAALPANFPYSAVALLGVVTLTAKNAGTVGNYLNPIYNYRGRSNYAPDGVAINVIRTTAGSGNPAPINYSAAIMDCSFNTYALLSEDTAWQRGMQEWIASQWECDTPMGFGCGYTYNSGTLGQVLGAGNNSAEFNRLAYPINDANVPWLLVAEYAAKSACISCTHPEESIQGPVRGVLECARRPGSCSLPWSFEDRKQLDAAGFVVYGPLTQTPGVLTAPYIYNDITNSIYDELGRLNYTWRDTTTRRWAAMFSSEIAVFLNTEFNGLAAFVEGTEIRPGVFGTTKSLMRGKILAWLRTKEGQEIGVIRDVDAQVQVTSDFDTAPPCKGVPGKYAVRLVLEPGIRIKNIHVTLLPKLLSNCVR